MNQKFIVLPVCFFVMFLSVLCAAPDFTPHQTGDEFPINYEEYGVFKDVGTPQYEYLIQAEMGLAEAIGDGIAPNNFSIFSDPHYMKLVKERRLKGSRWEYVNAKDIMACYFKWATEESEEPGVKLFYTAHNLERAGLIRQALKAYYACVVHFPRSVGWTYWKTPWYVGVTSLNIIESLLRTHPEIGYTLVGARVDVKNGYDIDISNDVFSIDPGKFVKTTLLPKPKPVSKKIIRSLGGKHAKVVQYETGEWAFFLNQKPVLLKTVSYGPAPVMQSFDEGTMSDWMVYDTDKNGIPDSPLESFVDKNRNNLQDKDEPSVGDFQLLKDMGANSIRLYHHATNKELLRKAHKEYGLSVLMGDLLGMYGVGSKASWEEGTNYSKPEHRKNMLESVKEMVLAFKDEPYVALWVLGNENNYGGVFGHVGGAGNAGTNPKAYYSFVNEVAAWIKTVDKTRPIAICNGDTGFMDVFAAECPNIDVFGVNAYRGKHGFGRSLWTWAKQLIDRPVLIMEYGCPAFHEGQSFEVANREQEEYHVGCWRDIEANSFLGIGAGTSIGGVAFQWIDGWWKSGQPPRYSAAIHETVGQWPGPFPDGWSYEEWYGIVGQGDGSKTPFLRVLRPVYYMYQKLWRD